MRTDEINPTAMYINHDDRLGGCETCAGQVIIDLIDEWDADGQIEGNENWDLELVEC